MIYVTGDTHIPIDIHKLNTKHFPQQREMTAEDYVIICGDFGLIWSAEMDNEEKYWTKWLNNKNFTTLFVDGNHENFHRLASFPTVPFHGGQAQQISDKIFHLCRGQVYEIQGQKIFTMGGASSHDKQWRKEYISWWKEELPSYADLDFADKNLEKHDYNVDIVLSHCCSTYLQARLNPTYSTDLLTEYFEYLRGKLTYRHWFFGHYHQDKDVDEKHHCLYQNIRRIP